MLRFRILVAALLTLGVALSAPRAGILTPILTGNHAVAGSNPFTLIAHTSAGSTINGGTTVTSPAINTTGANLFLIGICGYSSPPTDTVSDSSGSNTYTLGPSAAQNTAQNASLWYKYAPATGTSQTFTTVSGGSGYRSITVEAFSGAASSPYDQHNSALAASGTTIQAGSITPSVNNELAAIVGSVADATLTMASINQSFILTDTVTGVTNERVGCGLSYLKQTTAAAVNPTYTASGSSSSGLGAAMASFK